MKQSNVTTMSKIIKIIKSNSNRIEKHRDIKLKLKLKLHSERLTEAGINMTNQ